MRGGRDMRVCGFDARIAVLAAVWSGPATSFTGVELFDLCFRKGVSGELACTSYVRGLADGIAFASIMAGGKSNYCPPPSVQAKEMRVIVDKYLRDHRDQLTKEAGALVGIALYQAFPCKGSH
jgi:hypothetical protein